MKAFALNVICFSEVYPPAKYHNVKNLLSLHQFLCRGNFRPTAYNCYDPRTRQFVKQFKANEFLPYHFENYRK